MELRLARSGKMIGGVCRGISNWLEIDVSVVRLTWVLLTIMFGIGIPMYLAAWFILPSEKN